jgi:hypothetical protein
MRTTTTCRKIVKLTPLTPAHAEYIVPIEGPDKPDHYRY